MSEDTQGPERVYFDRATLERAREGHSKILEWRDDVVVYRSNRGTYRYRLEFYCAESDCYVGIRLYD